MDFFKKDTKTALEAMNSAQWIAFAPMVFQASRILRDSGILSVILESRNNGLTLDEIASKIKMPRYGIRVLLESGLGIGLVILNEDRYTITKTGYFILRDELTKVNMDFSQDVCYQAMFHLEDSIYNERPEGLKVLGNWRTIYEGLSILPGKSKKSWFNFDHYYSDNAFELVLPLVFKDKPKKLLDIGGNTGKWALKCVKYDSDVMVTIADLPGQVGLAKANIEEQGFADRITFVETDLLDETKALPKGHDAIWMSQFLDCFSEKEIISIMKRCHDALEEGGFVYIQEPFWDKQEFESGAFSLQQTSLYFTAIANGNSQMYDSKVFLKCLEAAGFEVAEETNRIGVTQTLLKCRKKQ